MMRKWSIERFGAWVIIAVVFMAILALAGSWPASGQAPARPAFEFKGFRAGDIVPPEMIDHCDPDTPRVCSGKVDNKIAGYEAWLVSVALYDKKVSFVSIMADTIAFKLITDAFKAKYGAPCLTSVGRWNSRIGRSLPNVKYTWCFKTGRLTAEQHGATIDSSTIEYHDQNAIPDKPRVKVDF